MSEDKAMEGRMFAPDGWSADEAQWNAASKPVSEAREVQKVRRREVRADAILNDGSPEAAAIIRGWLPCAEVRVGNYVLRYELSEGAAFPGYDFSVTPRQFREEFEPMPVRADSLARPGERERRWANWLVDMYETACRLHGQPPAGHVINESTLARTVAEARALLAETAEPREEPTAREKRLAVAALRGSPFATSFFRDEEGFEEYEAAIAEAREVLGLPVRGPAIEEEAKNG